MYFVWAELQWSFFRNS